jgi:hypothetical protein
LIPSWKHSSRCSPGTTRLAPEHRFPAALDDACAVLTGVPAELHHWPGTFHGSQAILSAEVSQRQTAELTAALRRAAPWPSETAVAGQAGRATTQKE